MSNNLLQFPAGSDVLLRRLGASYESRIEAACSEGKGIDLLSSFMKEIAELKASSVFLKIGEDAPALAAEYSEEEIAKIIDDFCIFQGLKLVENIGEVCKSYGVSPEQLAGFVKQTTEAFSKKLNDLFEKSSSGGAA